MESAEVRRRTMQAVKSKDTGVEMRVRRLAHSDGYRYRLHARHLAGCPDLVFSSRKSVIFIHGCFWHGHQCSRGHRLPKSNAAYWEAKITRNSARDAQNIASLEAVGWKALVIWECETKDESAVRKRLRGFLGRANTQRRLE